MMSRFKEHEWKAGLLKRHPEWIACAACGIMKRSDGKNGQCAGRVKVTMRKRK